MFNDSTSHTTLPLEHYSGDSNTIRRRNSFEAVFPIVMIVIGIAGIVLMFS